MHQRGVVMFCSVTKKYIDTTSLRKRAMLEHSTTKETPKALQKNKLLPSEPQLYLVPIARDSWK